MSLNSLKVRNAITLKPNSTPTNPENGDIYYDATANVFYFYQNGAFISIPVSTSSPTFDNLTLTGYEARQELVDTTTTGSAAVLNSAAASLVVLTNVSLTSLSTIPAGANGQLLILNNQTGAAITVNNDAGSPTANQITTGTGSNLSLANTASILMAYDNHSSKWIVVGGSGSGGGGGVSSVTASTPLASSGGTTPNISLTGTIPVANGGTGLTSVGTAGQLLESTGTGLQFVNQSVVGTIVAQYGVTTGATTAAGVPINFDTKIVDTNNAVTTGVGTWKFTAPVAGFYMVSNVISTSTNQDILLYKNGVSQNFIQDSLTGEVISSGTSGIQLNQGDTFYLSFNASGGTTEGGTAPRFLCSILITLVTGNVTASAPTVTTLLSGSGTYTVPTGTQYITVEMVGGGGGGSGGQASSGSGGSGGNTTFGTSLLTANGGSGGTASYGGGAGGSGGTVTVSSPAIQIVALQGGAGSYGLDAIGGSSNSLFTGWSGASSPFGGAGGSGSAAIANSGSGGGGGSGSGGTAFGGAGGGAGGYVLAQISSPSASYSYSIGVGGSTGGNGGSGAVGVIIVKAYPFQGGGSSITSSAQIQGTTSVGNAASGFLGEFISSNPSSGVAVGSSGAFVTITSISLTAGDWDVEGTVSLVTGATTAGTVFSGGISLNATSEDTQASGGVFDSFNTLVASSIYLSPTGKRRINIASTTTIFLVGAATYSVAGGATWGTNSFINARRVR